MSKIAADTCHVLAGDSPQMQLYQEIGTAILQGRRLGLTTDAALTIAANLLGNLCGAEASLSAALEKAEYVGAVVRNAAIVQATTGTVIPKVRQ